MAPLRFALIAISLAALLAIGGCTKARLSKNAPLEVDISNCSAPQADVQNGQSIHWVSTDQNVDYEIDFSSAEPTPSPFKVHGKTDQNRPILGNKKCIHNYSTKGCWYKYTLRNLATNDLCPDPVVHIEPQ